ncbi:hypothetical protein CXB51_022125 [Gossypium anomalum]|uniref:Uncharacterized protein n=1 Tax=Gossypium anomalum TaxID=47600 RepID=A0A8J5YGV5_9ROSI|nr:hypothetical protein CXB51_022125 [Gossypium anomalum]
MLMSLSSLLSGFSSIAYFCSCKKFWVFFLFQNVLIFYWG